MAKEQRKTATSMYYILFVGLPLSCMLGYFAYLWNYGYEPKLKEGHSNPFDPELPPPAVPRFPGPSAASSVRMSASLRMERAVLAAEEALNPARAVTATLCLRNEGQDRVRVLYTPWPSTLIQVRLYFLGASGKAARELLQPSTPSAAPAVLAGPGLSAAQRHLTADLERGGELVLPVALKPPFDLSRPGRYRLELVYAPDAFAAETHLNAAPMGVLLLALNPPPLEFSVEGPQPAPKPKAEAQVKSVAP